MWGVWAELRGEAGRGHVVSAEKDTLAASSRCDCRLPGPRPPLPAPGLTAPLPVTECPACLQCPGETSALSSAAAFFALSFVFEPFPGFHKSLRSF